MHNICSRYPRGVPRDLILLHNILADTGITGYQEAVLLQLMDFAYCYTLATLEDARHLIAAGNDTASRPDKSRYKRGAPIANRYDLTTVPPSMLRLSMASWANMQFNPTLPKDFQLEIAAELNQTPLPEVRKNGGLGLPPEQHCLLGVGWTLKEE